MKIQAGFFFLLITVAMMGGCAGIQSQQLSLQKTEMISNQESQNAPEEAPNAFSQRQAIDIIAGASLKYLSTSAKDAPLPETELSILSDNDILLDQDLSHLSPNDQQTVQALLDSALAFCELAQENWQQGELDQAVDALDNAYSLILKIEPGDNQELIQQIDDLRFTISRRILEIYTSRKTVAHGSHNEIPIILNQHVKAEIERFSRGGEKGFFYRAYKRSGKYRPMIVKMLKESGLPEELSWLPLIESGYQVKALSSARALGLWQFIPSTGYKFGLKRHRFVDERMDPEKSTKAAIAYLKELHNIFGDWTTVLAAYNCGEGRVLRTIRNQNVNYLDNFWDLYERLPRETARYVPRFLATLYMVNHPEKFGIQDVQVDPPLAYETVSLSKKVALKDIAKAIQVPESVLKELNPELRYDILPESEYQLKVPPGKEQTLIASIDRLPTATIQKAPVRTAYRYHRIKRGETLSTIAQKYGTSVKQIARLNRLRGKRVIIAGDILKIPTSYRHNREHVYQTQNGKKRSRKHISRHVVRSGDSLWLIARRYGSTTSAIKRANNLRSNRLQIGQVLKIPVYKAQKTRKKSTMVTKLGNRPLRTYSVRQGDVPLEIARKHNMSLERLLEVNHLTSRSKIFPGQTLYVD